MPRSFCWSIAKNTNLMMCTYFMCPCSMWIELSKYLLPLLFDYFLVLMHFGSQSWIIPTAYNFIRGWQHLRIYPNGEQCLSYSVRLQNGVWFDSHIVLSFSMGPEWWILARDMSEFAHLQWCILLPFYLPLYTTACIRFTMSSPSKVIAVFEYLFELI